MRRRCMFCDAKLSRQGRRMCFTCLNKGPYGHKDTDVALLYACSATNYKGEPCKQWSMLGSAYCNAHKGAKE